MRPRYVLQLSLKAREPPMSQASIAETRDLNETLGPRFRLSGLMILVLGAALSLGVMTRAHVSSTSVRASYWESPLSRWLGVVMAPLGVALGLTLGIQVFSQAVGRESRGRRIWPICWRLAALALLATLLAEESSLLRVEPSSLGSPNWSIGGMDPLTLDARLRLLPAAEGLLMAGLVLGLRSRRSRAGTRRREIPAWSRSVLAGLGGTLIVASMMIVPYLVLIAIEAVENAKQHPGEASAELLTSPARPPMPPGLANRLDGAIPEIGLAFFTALAAAGWIGSSMRQAADRGDENRTDHGPRRELIVGLTLAIAVLIAAGLLVFRVLPAVQRHFLSGMRQITGGWELGVIVLGFGCFSAGLIAHALAPGINGAASGWGGLSISHRRLPAALAKAAATVLLLLVILASVAEIHAHSGWSGFGFPCWLGFGLFDPLQDQRAKAWKWLQGNQTVGMLSFDASLWFPALVIPWLAWRSVGLLVSAGSPRPSPFDQALDSPASARRFAGYWCALLALLLAAVPTLALTGLVILHHALGLVAR
jgi:hypothetical protein